MAEMAKCRPLGSYFHDFYPCKSRILQFKLAGRFQCYIYTLDFILKQGTEISNFHFFFKLNMPLMLFSNTALKTEKFLNPYLKSNITGRFK